MRTFPATQDGLGFKGKKFALIHFREANRKHTSLLCVGDLHFLHLFCVHALSDQPHCRNYNTFSSQLLSTIHFLTRNQRLSVAFSYR